MKEPATPTIITTTNRCPTSRERRMLEQAAKLAKTSAFPTFKHGAVLARGASIHNQGVNKNQYCSFAARFKKNPKHATIHAELGCILGVDRSITEGATVYVARINKTGEWKNSKPCKMCQAAMEHVGIRKAVYTIDQNTIGEMRIC